MKTIGWKAVFTKKHGIFLAVLAVALLLPLIIKGNYIISISVSCFIFASLGVAWNIIGGYGAQISWCHAAFLSVGAYTNFILSTNFGISPFVSMPLGMGISYLLSTVIGYGTFRLRGAYFSIATIAFAESVRILLQYCSGVTKGAAGIYMTYAGNSFMDLTFKNDRPFYYITLFLLLGIVFVTFRFTRSKTGYYLGAIKGDEDATESLGIETFKVKLTAFQLSAMLTSLVGAFYASFLTYIAPASTCSLDLSIKIGVIAIVGGIGTLWGPVLGAFLVVPLIEMTSVLLGQHGGSQMLYGLLLIVIVIYKPTGVISLFHRSSNAGEKQNQGKGA